MGFFPLQPCLSSGGVACVGSIASGAAAALLCLFHNLGVLAPPGWAAAPPRVCLVIAGLSAAGTDARFRSRLSSIAVKHALSSSISLIVAAISHF